MGLLNLDALSATPLATDPFEYLIVERFIDEDGRAAIVRGFPAIKDAGSFPLSELQVGPGLQALIDEMNGPALRRMVEQKFGQIGRASCRERV